MRPLPLVVGKLARSSPFTRPLIAAAVSVTIHSRKRWPRCRVRVECLECPQSPECLVCPVCLECPVWVGRPQEQALKRRRRIRRRVRLEKADLDSFSCTFTCIARRWAFLLLFEYTHFISLRCRPGQFGLAAAVPPCIGGLEYMYGLEKVILFM